MRTNQGGELRENQFVKSRLHRLEVRALISELLIVHGITSEDIDIKIQTYYAFDSGENDQDPGDDDDMDDDQGEEED